MSWDIVLFSSRQRIERVEEVDEGQLEPIDFDTALVQHFESVVTSGTAREIIGEDFHIVYYPGKGGKLMSNTILNLYGEKALYAIIILAKKRNWQIYDTGIGQMIDLENPTRNGYENFHEYLAQILGTQD